MPTLIKIMEPLHTTTKSFNTYNMSHQDIEPTKHKSLDHRKVDSYGRQLLQFCDHRNLTILNGCTTGDSQGQFTYEVGNTCSVIDYSIVSQSLWPHIKNVQVANHNSILSDHSLITTEINLHSQTKEEKNQTQQTPPSSNSTGHQRLHNAYKPALPHLSLT